MHVIFLLNCQILPITTWPPLSDHCAPFSWKSFYELNIAECEIKEYIRKYNATGKAEFTKIGFLLSPQGEHIDVEISSLNSRDLWNSLGQ